MTMPGLFIPRCSPVTGQRAIDEAKWRGLAQDGSGGVVMRSIAALPASMHRRPQPLRGALMLGIALLGLGNVFFEFASVELYNAMLNHLG